MAHVRKTTQELIAQEQKKGERAKARIAELKGQREPTNARETVTAKSSSGPP